MSAEPQRHLRTVEEAPAEELVIIDVETGERHGTLADYVQGKDDIIAGLTRDVHAEHQRFENLKRDKGAEAREDPLWPKVLEVFKHWQQTCKHTRSPFTVARFEEALPYVKDFGVDMCKRAVDGIAYDPFITERRNGTRKRHDGWHLIFGDAEKFEERCNAAPPRPKPKPEDPPPDPEAPQLGLV